MSRRKEKDRPKTGLGERLKKLRVARGLTQPALAHELGLAPGTISRWERETGEPQAEQLAQLKQFFGVSLDYLLLGDEDSMNLADAPKELHYFLTMTPAGKWAREHNLVRMLMEMPPPASVEFYRQVTIALRMLYDEAAEEASAKTEQIKKPTK